MRSDPSRTLGCYGAFLDALTFARAPLVRRDTLLVEPPTQLPRTIHLRPAGRRALAASQPALGVSRAPLFHGWGTGLVTRAGSRSALRRSEIASHVNQNGLTRKPDATAAARRPGLFGLRIT